MYDNKKLKVIDAFYLTESISVRPVLLQVRVMIFFDLVALDAQLKLLKVKLINFHNIRHVIDKKTEKLIRSSVVLKGRIFFLPERYCWTTGLLVSFLRRAFMC